MDPKRGKRTMRKKEEKMPAEDVSHLISNVYNPLGLFFFLLLLNSVLNFKVEQRPRTSFTLNPMVSVAVGLGAAILIGVCALIIALRVACGRRNRRKDLHNSTTVRVASPGPSIKSIGSKDYEGNESDEKNPDIIPENIDSDDQVRFHGKT